MIDIVARLRHFDLPETDSQYRHEVAGRAADEIERLRTALEEILDFYERPVVGKIARAALSVIQQSDGGQKMPDPVEFLMERARAVSNIGKPESDNNYGRAASEIKGLRLALGLAAARLSICADRMRGCNDTSAHPLGPHELVDEVDEWVSEARSSGSVFAPDGESGE